MELISTHEFPYFSVNQRKRKFPCRFLDLFRKLECEKLITISFELKEHFSHEWVPFGEIKIEVKGTFLIINRQEIQHSMNSDLKLLSMTFWNFYF